MTQEVGAATVAPTSTVAYDTGIEIAYFNGEQKGEKRKYEIRSRVEADSPGGIEGWTDFREVPSVTTVLEALEKGGLTWWGMAVGVDAVIQLFNMGLLFPVEVITSGRSQIVMGLRDEATRMPVVAGKDAIIDIMKKHNLTTNDARDAGGERGQSAHDMLEIWAKTGELPDPKLFPPSEQPYITGLMTFLQAIVAAGAEPVRFETMVASDKYGFAGRYDIDIRLPKEVTLVAHHTPVKGPQYTKVPPGLITCDLKTSKGVYYSQAKQLAGYSIARAECGLEHEDSRAVIQVEGDGQYRFVRVDQWAEEGDFLSTLAEYNSQQSMKSRKPKGGSS